MPGKAAGEGKVEQALRIFRRHGKPMRTRDALARGIHPRTLYAMRDAGLVQQVSRGLYTLTEAPPLGNPDLVAVALRVPEAVICLVSALAYHDLTTQIPHAVYIAIPKWAHTPTLEDPPLEVFEFGGRAHSEGIEIPVLDGVPVRIYCPEKTLADCFKYRHRIGVDTAVEALRAYVERRDVQVEALMRYARVCRVAKVMRPYLEMVL